jgi:DNA-binding NarL/FixJ family response regulator
MSIRRRAVRLLVQEVVAAVLHITPSERSTLEFLALGKATAEIAELLHVSADEVEARLDALFTRMGVRNRAEAVAAASRRGLVEAAAIAPPNAAPLG